MGRELDSEHSIEVLFDASANTHINLRVGARKIKHVGARQLWLQERVLMGDPTIKKMKIKHLLRRIDTPLVGTRWKFTLSQHASAPLRAPTERLHCPRRRLELFGSRRCPVKVRCCSCGYVCSLLAIIVFVDVCRL